LHIGLIDINIALLHHPHLCVRTFINIHFQQLHPSERDNHGLPRKSQ